MEFLESLSQWILAGIILVGRLDVPRAVYAFSKSAIGYADSDCGYLIDHSIIVVVVVVVEVVVVVVVSVNNENTSGEETPSDSKPSEDQIRGRRAVCAVGLQGQGSRERYYVFTDAGSRDNLSRESVKD